LPSPLESSYDIQVRNRINLRITMRMVTMQMKIGTERMDMMMERKVNIKDIV
jgi:hypothetical protein